MKDIVEEVLNSIRSGWRFRWYAIALAWALAIAGWVSVYLMPDKYEASARVYVDTKSILKPLLSGLAVESDIGEQLAMMTRTLVSRPNLARVIRESDLDLLVKSEEEMDALVEVMMNDISIRSSGRDNRRRGSSDNLFNIKYINKNPETAKKVVQELLNVFIESSIGDERVETETAARFLNEQIASYEARLVAAENRLTEFKRKNVGTLPDQEGGIFQRHQIVKNQHEDALLELKEAARQRDELNRQLQALLSAGSEQPPIDDDVQNPYKQRIYALEQRQDELLLKYTDQHPDVIEINRKIATLQEQLKKSEEDSKEDQRSNSIGAIGENEALDQLKLQLATAEGNVAALNVREGEYRRRVEELNLLMDTIPQVEAELTRLNRDYEANKANYDTLVQRRESAVISKDVGETGDSVKFRIIDPPHVPALPASPKRDQLSLIVLLAALAGGGALAFLLSILNPVFYDTSTLRRETEYPVFGSVSRVWTSGLKRKRGIEVAFFIVSSMVLFALFIMVEIMYFIGDPDQLLIAIRGLM